MSDNTKVCKRCLTEKPIDDFRNSRAGTNGKMYRRANCRDCDNAIQRDLSKIKRERAINKVPGRFKEYEDGSILSQIIHMNKDNPLRKKFYNNRYKAEGDQFAMELWYRRECV